MASQVMKNASLLIHSLKLATHTNAVEFAAEAESVECTNFASGGNKEYAQGLRTTNLAAEMFFDSAADPEETLNALLEDETDAAFTVTQTYPPVAGDVAWFAKAVAVYQTIKIVIGQLYSGSMKFANRDRAVRGVVMEYNTARTATGDSASTTIAATGATEKLCGVVHVLAATGTTPTLDLVIESDADDTYASATTRYTVPQFTTVGSHYFTVDGPITDTEVRVAATVSGTTPSFEYLVAIGIAAF